MIEAFGAILELFPEMYPELIALKDIPQNPSHHPEGNAYIHTLLVMREMEHIIARDNKDDQYAILMNAAMCHDLGKASTTVIHEDGSITAYGHDDAGVDPSITLLQRLGVGEETIAYVLPLVKEHMAHAAFGKQVITNRAIKRLARRLRPANIEMWALLVESDASGRLRGNVFPEKAREIRDRARLLGVNERIDD